MSTQELILVIQWWMAFWIIGSSSLPITSLIFKDFSDKGYIFAKTIGLIFVSYIVFLLSILRIAQFSLETIYFSILIVLFVNILILIKQRSAIKYFKEKFLTYSAFEILFFIGILFWSFIKGFGPDIYGLEKYMDFGFMNSILRSDYLPAADMWFAPHSINYYYYGHFVAALMTKFTQIPSNISYNLMIATIFSFTFASSFSIALNLFDFRKISRNSVITGIFAGLFVSFAGNLHTIYSLFKPYTTDNPIPFWSLFFSASSFPNSYWYPNATRFIPFTIHEFPLYSFVVSDLHGHVSDIPFVLLTIALLLAIFLRSSENKQTQKSKVKSQNQNLKLKSFFYNREFLIFTLLALVLAVMYMTNAWDGAIYMLLSSLVIIALTVKKEMSNSNDNIKYQISNIKYQIYSSLKYIGVLVVGYFVFTLPFNLNFKPFVSGIGVLCSPHFLTQIGKIGPFLFEANHCQKSTLWQLFILYGFFYFFVFSYSIFILKIRRYQVKVQDYFVILLIFLSTLLIIVPEFVYVKDIYPNHYRANTMFKLVYQSFILLSISSAYILVKITRTTKSFPFFLSSMIFIGIVLAYPYFAIPSYYNKFINYKGLDGTKYLKTLRPYDYEAILWINKNIKGQPVMLEAQGDSYTDYARISANTGIPTVLGWTVHEWLWRGSYDVPAPRITDIQIIYENTDTNKTTKILRKYNVKYVYIGGLEREKYKDLFEKKFDQIGKVVYQNGDVKIYQIYNL
ncbi:hypothetical protein C4577_01375 [Candidatus Parcubacteria bacterium]|nr:MAG: hypothetical protein C4577_01375 [Candidatus Parcubacteria bacterium]